MYRPLSYFILLVLAGSCNSSRKIVWEQRGEVVGGALFYQKAAPLNWKQRDSLALETFMKGNIPAFLKKLVPVHVSMNRPGTGEKITATFFVTPDYLSVGYDGDWARIHITPMAAQRIADSLDCFLPTRKMVDDIYRSAVVKLEPIPMYAFRDSTPTMWHHHLIIEGQRQGKKGLIAGIKKDVVISGKILRDKKPDRVAIYGWHKLNGTPIQPLYTGHVNWWVDYSQGIRLVWRRIKVGNRWMDYKEVFSDPVLKNLLCDEEDCDFLRY